MPNELLALTLQKYAEALCNLPEGTEYEFVNTVAESVITPKFDIVEI